MKANQVTKDVLCNDPNYTPQRLLNYAIFKLNVRTYKDLSELIGFGRNHLSDIARRRCPVTSHLMVALMDAIPDLSLAEVRKLAGMPKEN